MSDTSEIILARRALRDLEDEVAKLIRAYQDSTGITVYEVRVATYGPVGHVKVKIRAEL